MYETDYKWQRSLLNYDLIKELFAGGVGLDGEFQLSIDRSHSDVYLFRHSQAGTRSIKFDKLVNIQTKV